MPEDRQEARRIIAEVARAVDRRLAVEVRELPGERLQLILTHGTHHAQIELGLVSVLGAAESAIGRNELRLRLKRATDTMLFKNLTETLGSLSELLKDLKERPGRYLTVKVF